MEHEIEKDVFLALFKDNWDGEGEIRFVVVKMKDGVALDYETGEPLVETRGDEILGLWQPTYCNEYRDNAKNREWRCTSNFPKIRTGCIDVLLKNDVGRVVYGYFNSHTYDFCYPDDEYFVADYWQYIGEDLGVKYEY